MIAIICAIASGMTIVLSRSINGYLEKKIGPYQSTFFNYFTGLLTSSILLFFTLLPAFKNISFTKIDLIMLVGGIIGVFNVLILNIVVSKVTPIKLTLITFISQLLSGMILDYYIYHVFTLNKLIGCIIVIIGLIIYQSADIKVISNEEINSI